MLDPEHIQELLDQTTPGPWEWNGIDLDGSNFDSVLDIQVDCGEFCQGGVIRLDGTSNLEYDQELISLAPELAQDWLWLRRELEHLARNLEEFTEGLDSVPTDEFAAQQIHYILNGEK